MTNEMSATRVSGDLTSCLFKGLAFALATFGMLSSLDANEWVIQGQIHGIDSNEGVWVGIVTGEPSYRVGVRIPHDDFERDETPERKNHWAYSATGDFKINTVVEEEAALLVVPKNRIPIEIPLHSEDDELPIEVTVSRGVGVKGFVRSENGKPIVGAKISVQSGGKSHLIPLFALPTWKTAKDGSFELGGLKDHRHCTLAVTAEGYAPVILQALKIPEGGIEGLEIELEKGYFVSGKVVASDGEHLSGVKVYALWTRDAVRIVESDGKLEVKGGGWNRYRTGAYTNSDGSFQIGPLASGTTGRLYVRSESMGSAITREISVPYDDLVLRLSQESVRGWVLDKSSGAPIEKYSVSMRIGETKSHTIESSDGVFNIPVFPIDTEGTVIRINAPEYGHWTGQLYGGSSGEYDIGEVTLEKQRTIRGIVRDGSTGLPMSGVRVFGRFEHLTSFAISDGEGAFVLDRLDSRVTRLSLLVPRRAYAAADIPPGAEELEIDLHLDGVIEGSLVLPDGTPVKGVVEIDGPDWMFPWKFPIEGTFRLEGLAPDTYTLTAETDTGLVESKSITLKANERLSDVNLIVQPGLAISGSITGLSGLESVEITVQDSDSRVLIRKSFTNGRYALHGLPSNATVVAQSSSGLTFIREILDGNETGRVIDFHFGDGSTLSGWLTTGGKPLGGMSLKIRPENPNAVIANVTTTRSGRYEVHRLADGRHVIRTDTGHSFAVDIGGDTTINIDVPENSLSGFVRSERTRLPVGGGLVKLVHVDSADDEHPLELTKRVGSDGTFLFEGLVSGHYDILVEHPNAEVASSRMYVSGLQAVELSVPCANTRECFERPVN